MNTSLTLVRSNYRRQKEINSGEKVSIDDEKVVIIEKI
jgi:ribosome-associated protein YbcJ (S4-like RNA binding protein)